MWLLRNENVALALRTGELRLFWEKDVSAIEGVAAPRRQNSPFLFPRYLSLS
jgi:hypothetical protein